MNRRSMVNAAPEDCAVYSLQVTPGNSERVRGAVGSESSRMSEDGIALASGALRAPFDFLDLGRKSWQTQLRARRGWTGHCGEEATHIWNRRRQYDRT